MNGNEATSAVGRLHDNDNVTNVVRTDLIHATYIHNILNIHNYFIIK